MYEGISTCSTPGQEAKKRVLENHILTPVLLDHSDTLSSNWCGSRGLRRQTTSTEKWSKKYPRDLSDDALSGCIDYGMDFNHQ
jgi:hypothetical protein